MVDSSGRHADTVWGQGSRNCSNALDERTPHYDDNDLETRRNAGSNDLM